MQPQRTDVRTWGEWSVGSGCKTDSSGALQGSSGSSARRSATPQEDGRVGVRWGAA